MVPTQDYTVREDGQGKRLPSLEEIRALVRQDDSYRDGIDGYWVIRCPGCEGFLRGPLPGTYGLGTCQSCGGVVGVDTYENIHKYVPSWWAKRVGPGRKTYFDCCYPSTSGKQGFSRIHGWFQRSGITQVG